MTRRERGKRVNGAAWLYLPSQRLPRYLWVTTILVLGLLWLPAWVGFHTFALWTAERNVEIEIDALAQPLPYTNAEARLAADLLSSGAVLSASPPIWDAPGDGGYFSVSRGSSARISIDGAIATTRAIRTLLDTGRSVDDPEVVALIATAQNHFDSVGEQQDRDRGAVLYHRALLDIWRGNRATAIEDLTRLIGLIEEIENRGLQRPLTRTQRRRVGGVEVATLYARAVARASGPTDDNARRAAIADLRAARDKATELESLGASARGPFVELNEQAHLVAMSTAPIWNDLIVLSMRSGGGSRQALREVALLVENPSYVQAHPVLASNLMALAAVGEGDASIEQRRELASALGAPLRLPDETPAQAETRLRAAAVYAIVGLSLPDDVVPRGSRETPVRTAFKEVFPSAPGFNHIDLPRVRGSAQQLDSWLFIREWREQLGAGALDRFQDSFDTMRDLEPDVAIDATFFERWRNEINPVLERRIGVATRASVQSAEQRRSLFRYAVIEADRPFLSRFLDALRYSSPWWWALVLLWLATSAVAVSLIVVIRSAYKVFRPTHYLVRTGYIGEER